MEESFLNPKDPFDSDSDDRGCESDCDEHDHHTDLNVFILYTKNQ